MTLHRKLTVVAIHGESNRERVNADKAAINRQSAIDEARYGRVPGPHLTAEPNEPPQVLVVLRDADHHERVELHLTTWEDVEEMKLLAGYDVEKHHWKHGAEIMVSYT